MKKMSLRLVTTLLLSTPCFSYADGKLTAELIFPPQAKHVHSSTIEELPNGDLIAAWFYGSGERRANDVDRKSVV